MTDKPQPPTPPKRLSGVQTALKYTGIPPSWLEKRPKLPSRNWLIFLSITSSLVGMYAYDRRQCKKIRQEYVDKVKHLSEEMIRSPLDPPRKVTVYGAKWPGDEDHDQALRHFRKYVKPILVAAAIDYEPVSGKKLGDVARRVAEDVRIRRRFDAGLDIDSEALKLTPTYKPLAERRERELEGGIIIIGRTTLKEFFTGLKRGWSEGLQKVDPDEALSKILENDNAFDEQDDDTTGHDQEPSKSPIPTFVPPHLSLSQLPSHPNAPGTPSLPLDNTSPIPPLPPLLLVPFSNRIGLSQIPLMIWDWFNQRHKVLSGAQAGYRLVMKATEPVQGPPAETQNDSASSSGSTATLFDFDKEAESLFKRSLKNIPEETEAARRKYYEALAARLKTARDLSRGVREPTKEEYDNPPPTEVELRAERLKKERRWRADIEGWDIVKPSTGVPWDERFEGAIRMFVDPKDSSEP